MDWLNQGGASGNYFFSLFKYLHQEGGAIELHLKLIRHFLYAAFCFLGFSFCFFNFKLAGIHPGGC